MKTGLLALALVLSACTKVDDEPHPALRAGIETIERVTGETLDDDFGHPDFERAVTQLREVPRDHNDFQTAAELIQRIRAGRERYDARLKTEAAAAAEADLRKAEAAASLEAKIRRMAEEGREEEANRSAARAKAERLEAEARARRIQADARIADRLAAERNRRTTKRKKAERARARRAAADENRKAHCEAVRAACRERCTWVRTPTGRSGGLGSPISIKCMQRCPVCE